MASAPIKKQGSFLNVTDANIEQSEEGAARSAARALSTDDVASASTPRAAPCIALPKQHHEALRHVAVGALSLLVLSS